MNNNVLDNNEILLQGRFIIQKIYKIEFANSISYDDIISSLNEKLPEFKSGNPEDPGKGFRLIEKKEVPERIIIDQKLLDIFNNLIIIEFQKEKYENIIVRYKNNKPVYEKKFPKLITNHVFIVFPDYVIFKGSKENLELLESIFFNILRDKINKKEVNNV